MTRIRVYVGLALLALQRAWEDDGPSDFFTSVMVLACAGTVALVALGVV